MVGNSCRGKKTYHKKQTNAKQSISAKLLSHNIKCSAKSLSHNIKCSAECTLQSSAVCKCFLQKLHIYFQELLSQCDSACIRAMCVFLCEGWRNTLSHIGHSYGFCPLWTLLWTRAWLGVLNVWSQKSHFSGFSPVWTRQCRARSLAQLKNFLQSVHCTLFFLPFFFGNWLRRSSRAWSASFFFFFGSWLRRSSRAWSASFFCTAIINTSNSLTHSTVGHFIFRQDQSLTL